MYELKAGEIVEELEEAVELHGQYGPIMFMVARGHKPMLCCFVDLLKNEKLKVLDKYGRIHVTDGKKKSKIQIGKIQKIIFIGHEELVEMLKSLLNGIDELVEFSDVIEKQLHDMKSKILDLGLTLNRPWIKL